MYKCKKCSKEFEKKHAYIGHCSSHNRGETYKIGRKKKDEEKIGNKKCKHCGKEFSNHLKLGGHQTHCSFNPNKILILEKISKINKGKKMSDEQKKKISISRKKHLDENPGKIPYLLNHSSKESYPEKLFRECLEANNIKGWIQEFPFRRYSLDFAFIDQKIDVEIDGSTHNLKKVILIDKEKEKILSYNGWQTIRFKDYEIKNKMEECLNKLKELIILRGKQV